LIDQVQLGARLAYARQERKLSQDDVAEVLKVSRVLLSYWEQGERRPSEPVLERLANVFGVSLSDLLDPEAPLPPSTAQDLAELLYRDADGGIDARAKAGLQDFVRFLDTYAGLLDRLNDRFVGLKQSPFHIRRGFTGKEDVRRKAEEVRSWLRLGLGPIGDLAGLLDDVGITIYTTALGVDLTRSVSGAFLNHPRLGMCIAVNLETTPGRQRFTLAHELAHALLHSNEQNRVVSYWGRKDEKERFADAWASEFLMPQEALRRATETMGVTSISQAEEVVHLQRYFGTSYGQTLFRLQQARLVGSDTFDALRAVQPVAIAASLGYEIDRDEWSQDPRRWRLERFPRRFVRLLMRALRSELLSPDSAASLTNLTLDEMTELISPVADGDPNLAEELNEFEDVRRRAAAG
jgi:Zn-dependent peptidase ImmA (M78 family)/transcriptional regulator with XRE-family HTH domain